MRFLSLRAENFMRLGDVTLPLDNQGLVLILGENRDASKASSNGAGKSALLDALCWCLWGKTVRGLSGDEVVRRDVGKCCRVSVDWEDSGRLYKVVRLRNWVGAKKPNDLIFEVDGESDDGAGIAKTQENIDKALGLTFTTFQVMMPGAGIKLAELTDTGIKEHLERLLQMDIISKAQEITKEKLKKLEPELTSEEKNIDTLLEKLAEYEDILQKYSDSNKNFEVDKKTEILKIQGEIGTLLTRREKVLKRIESSNKAKELQAKVQTKIENKQLEWMTQLNIEATCRKLIEQHDANVRDETTKIRTQIKLLEEKMHKFEHLGSFCDQCNQAVPDEHKDQHSTYFTRRYSTLTDSLENYISKVANNRIKLESNRLDIETKAKKLKAEVDLLSDQLNKLTVTITDGNYATKEADDLCNQIQNLNVRQQAVEAMEAPFQSLIADVIEKSYDTAASCARAKARAKELRKKVRGLTFWVEGFSTRGLRSLMLRHVTPILNSRAKYYADILTDGEMSIEFFTEKLLKNGKTKEEFNVHVVQAHGDDSYGGSSTGERARADLAIAFALGDLAHLRANKRIPFRFLDEPFESIDTSGHESIVRLLNEQRSQYSTVLVITHKESFQQLFPKAIRVVKEGGISRLEQDNE